MVTQWIQCYQIYAPQVATLGGKFATSFLEKVCDNIDSVIEESNKKKNIIRSSSVGGNNGCSTGNNNENDLADQLVTNSARSISAAAKESANVLKPLIANSNGGRNN